MALQLISFGGSQLYRPGAYSTVNVVKNTPVTPGAFKILAVIGSGAAGQPGVPLYYNNPSLASLQIGGNDALLAAQIAWEHGADLICFSLSDVATPGTYLLKDTTGTPKTITTLKGQRYSATDNLLQVTVAVAAGGKQVVTITDTSVTPNVSESYTVADTATGWTTFANLVNNSSQLVTAGTVDTSGTNIGATVTSAAFTGGVRTAPTTVSTQAAIDALQTEDVQGIILTATDGTNQTAVFTHCNTLSNVVNRRERRAFFGQPLGTSVSGYTAALASFTSSNRALIAAPGIYRNVAGQKTLLSSAFTAAAIAGSWASKTNPNDPVTFSFLNALGLEKTYLNSEVMTLMQAQITVVEAVPKQGYRVTRALTTDQSGTNLVDLSVADLVDIMQRGMREILEGRFTGRAAYNGIVSDIKQLIAATLESYKIQNWLVDSVDAFGAPLPAYRNIVVSQAGTQFNVSYELAPSAPVNYITITTTVNV